MYQYIGLQSNLSNQTSSFGLVVTLMLRVIHVVANVYFRPNCC